MAELTVQSIKKAGTPDVDSVLSGAESGGDNFVYSSGAFIMLQNDDASSHTLTIPAPSSSIGTDSHGTVDISDMTLTVAAGKVGFITPPPGYSANNKISWTYDSVTSVKVGVFAPTNKS